MSAPSDRRGFLRGLVSLPLIGAPSAVAEPVTRALMDSYDAWLFYERWKVLVEKHGSRCELPDFGPIYSPNGIYDCIPVDNSGFRWQRTNGRAAQPSTRAALVLATVGCDWREDAR